MPFGTMSLCKLVEQYQLLDHIRNLNAVSLSLRVRVCGTQNRQKKLLLIEILVLPMIIKLTLICKSLQLRKWIN